MRQRAISWTGVHLAIRQGEPIEQDGATVYFLGRRHLPPGLPAAIAERLEGTVVVLGRDGALVTAYRRRRVSRRLRQRRSRRRRCWC